MARPTSHHGPLPLEVVRDSARWLLGPCKNLLEAFGGWPENLSFINLCANFFVCSLFTISTFGNMNMIIQNRTDLAIIPIGLLGTLTLTELLLRRVLMLIHAKKIRSLLLIIYYEFWPTSEVDEGTSRKFKRKTSILFNVWLVFIGVGVIWMAQNLVFTYVAGTKPMVTLYPGPLEKTPFFEIMYIVETYLSMEILFWAGTSLLIYSIVFNCAIQLELISEYFTQNFEKVIKIEDRSKRAKEASKLIFKCINQHTMLLEFSKSLNSVTKHFMMCRFLNAFGTISLTAFIISYQPDILITAALYSVPNMTELFVYCYVGNEVIHASTDLSDAIFQCGWHYMDVDANRDIQKSLSLMILRSQRPIQIAVGDFAFLTLDVYIQLVKFSFSIYTVLGNTINR